MNLVALDADGVFAETEFGMFEGRNEYADCAMSILFDGWADKGLNIYGISAHDFKTCSYQSIQLLARFATETNSQFVFVSSWVFSRSRLATYQGMEFVFQKILPREAPYFIGQTTGGGGHYREKTFLKFVKGLKYDNLFAIDDSGARHFPILHEHGLCCAPKSYDGFVGSDFMYSCYQLGVVAKRGSKEWFEKYFFPKYSNGERLKEINLKEILEHL